MFAAIQSVAPSLGVELNPVECATPGEIERDITAFARRPNGGLIVPGSAWQDSSRTDRHAGGPAQLPAVYPDRVFVNGGGLISYGPNRVDQFRRAAAYVDRILKGEKPADLPVQAPTKYELVINLKDRKGARPRPYRRHCSPAPTR